MLRRGGAASLWRPAGPAYLATMRPGTVLGALLVFCGVVALSIGGFSFTTPVPIPSVLAGVAIAVGVVLIIASSRKAR